LPDSSSTADDFAPRRAIFRKTQTSREPTLGYFTRQQVRRGQLASPDIPAPALGLASIS
jgi:hypothetical protein